MKPYATFDRRSLQLSDLLGAAEGSIHAVEFYLVLSRKYPVMLRHLGRALQEIANARVLLASCASLSRSALPADRAQDLRRRFVRGGVISQLRTTAKRGTQRAGAELRTTLPHRHR